MKKALFCLLIALMLMPAMSMAQKQSKDGSVVVITKDTTVCDSLVWAVNGVTYKMTDAIYYRKNSDTAYLLNLTVAHSTKEDIVLFPSCSYMHGRDLLNSDTTIVDSLLSLNRCDSVVTLILGFTHKNYDTTSVVTCHTYNFGGKSLNESGKYFDTTRNETLACDSIHVLMLSVLDTMKRTIDVEKCGAYRWLVKDSIYTASTTDTAFVAATNATACDSLLTLNVNITFMRDTVRASACGEYKIQRRNQTVTTSGEYFDTVISSSCPTYRVYELNITPLRTSRIDTNVEACTRLSMTFSRENRDVLKYTDLVTGREIIEDNVPQGLVFNNNSRATIHYGSKTPEKCFDSTIIVNVNIHRTGRSIHNEEACMTYKWTYVIDRPDTTWIYDTIWAYDTTWTDELKTVIDHIDSTVAERQKNGYSGIDIIHDSVRKNKTFNATAMDSVRVGTTIHRCDSFYVLSLKINPNPVIKSIDGKFKVLQGEKTFLYADCDQDNVRYNWTLSDGQTSNKDTLKVSVNANTDVTLRATNKTTGCYSESWVTILYGVGINDVANVKMDIYPNPTAQLLNVASEQTIRTAVVYTMTGIEVYRKNINATSATLNLAALAKGAYAIRFEMENGQSAIRNVIKSK